MLSFEDFFIKKKIDLTALRIADESLYREFEMHYKAMGEKSFDHSKKFWFNRLRKNYRLSEEVKSGSSSSPAAEKAAISTAAVDAAAKPAGFKPRFKAGLTKTAEPDATNPAPVTTPAAAAQETTDATATTTPAAAKPTGFKPRFKAGLTKTVKKNDSQTPGEE